MVIDMETNINKQKKKQKYKLADGVTNASECKIADSTVIGLKQNDFNSETLNGVLEKKKKKRKYKSADEIANVSECIITDSSAIGSNQDDFNSENLNRVPEKKKKKRKYKLADEEAIASECLITDSSIFESNQDNFYSETLTIVPKKKKKNQKYKLADEIANTPECEISDSSVIRSNQDDLNSENLNGVPEKKKKKQKYKSADEEVNDSECLITYSSIFESNQDSFNSETLTGVPKKKKRKYKLTDEKANTSESLITDSSIFGSSQDDFNHENLNGVPEKKKKKQKYKLADETGNASDCKITDSSTLELDQVVFNTEIPNGVPKRKKKKHRFDKTENIPYCNTQQSDNDESEKTDILILKRFEKHEQTKASYISNNKTDNLNVLRTNQATVDTENQNGSYKKKKHKLLEKKGNLSTSEDLELATTEPEKSRNIHILNDIKIIDGGNDLNSIALNRSHKKKKHKLLVEKEKLSYCNNQKLATNELHECNQAENNKTTDSDTIEKNYYNLVSKTFDGLNKTKKKKHKHRSHDLENSPVIESNYENKNLLNGQINDLEEKSSTQNLVDDSPIVNRKSKESFQKEVEVTVDHLPEKEIIVMSQSPEKEKNVTCQYPEKERNVFCKSSRKEKFATEKERNVPCNSPKKDTSAFCESQGKERIVSCKSSKKEKKTTSESPEKDDYQVDEGVYQNFDPNGFDLVDEPVPFIVPELHEGETAATVLPEEKAIFEGKGVMIRTGKWTKIEDDILIRNFVKFGLDFGVNNPFQLLGINQSKKNGKLAQFLNAKHFLVRLGKDLNDRTLRSIYMRARKLLHPLQCKRRLSENEASDLKHAFELVGKKWTRISDMLSRSEDNCHTAYRWHGSDISKGKWTLKEEKDLIEAIKTVSGKDDISVNTVKNLSWKEVANYVSTRNEFQCQKKWANHLAWDSSVTEKKTWQKCHYGKLIYLIKDKYCFNSESEIDFKELHKHFIDVTPSYMYLRKKWLYLKGRLPKDLKLSYGTCLNTLTRMYEKQFQIFANEETLTNDTES